MAIIPRVPRIPAEERTPLVEALLAVVVHLQEENAQLKQEGQDFKDEGARLKGQKPKPKIRPSRLNEGSKNPKGGKRPGSAKRSKTETLEIHETVDVLPKEAIPPGSEYKGHVEFTVVGLRLEPYNVRYHLHEWKTPDGRRLKGELPASQQAVGGHRRHGCTPQWTQRVLYPHWQRDGGV